MYVHCIKLVMKTSREDDFDPRALEVLFMLLHASKCIC